MTRDEEIWLAGYAQAVRDYAIHKDGELLVGCRQQLLRTVLDGLESSDFVLTSMKIHFEQNP